MPFTTKDWVGFSLPLCKCVWNLFWLLYFLRPAIKEEGNSLCLLLEFPISDSLNSRETVLLPAWLLSKEGEVSFLMLAPAVDKLITHRNMTELRTLKHWPSGGSRLGSFLGSEYCEMFTCVFDTYKINQVLPDPSDWSGNLELLLFFSLTISIPDKGIS